MKTAAAWGLVLWMALVFEHSRSDLFPSSSLMLPACVGCLFWLKNGLASILAGLALIVHWLLFPTIAPVDVAVVLLLGTIFVTRSEQQGQWTPMGSRQSQHAWWVHPMLVLLAGLAAHSVLHTGMNLSQFISASLARVIIAVPCLACLVFAIRAADEFGWRRRASL
ncbi:MAG: hypothetical protein WAO83_02525 [Fuerstiella sp.]